MKVFRKHKILSKATNLSTYMHTHKYADYWSDSHSQLILEIVSSNLQ